MSTSTSLAMGLFKALGIFKRLELFNTLEGLTVLDLILGVSLPSPNFWSYPMFHGAPKKI
jgi:hypothetical protein